MFFLNKLRAMLVYGWSYTWQIYATKVLNMASIYGFWRTLDKEERQAKQHYLHMFYNLQFRKLVSLGPVQDKQYAEDLWIYFVHFFQFFRQRMCQHWANNQHNLQRAQSLIGSYQDPKKGKCAHSYEIYWRKRQGTTDWNICRLSAAEGRK